MTQQQTPRPEPRLPDPAQRPAPGLQTGAKVALVLLGLLAAGVVAVGAWALSWTDHGPAAPTTHTVVYEATADSAYGSGRTGMVTAQAPGGTTQKTGLLPITGTYTFGSGDFVYLSVQNGQGLGSVTCRITVDGVVVSENTSDGGYTIATCQGKVS